MKVYQFLYQLFGFRINSDAEIPSYIHKISYTGKFDEPKKNAVITEVLVRLSDLDEQISSLREEVRRASQPVAVEMASPTIPGPVVQITKKKGGRPKGSKNKKK